MHSKICGIYKNKTTAIQSNSFINITSMMDATFVININEYKVY